MKSRLPHWINFTLFIITFVLSVSIKIDPPLWPGFADPYDYIYQSEISLTNKSFYFPERIDDFDPRPFTTPLFYKIANSRAERIIFLQQLMHSLSTLFLCFVILLFLRNIYSKILFVVFWYFLMSWWNILGWTHMLLSESLSISFLFIWIASFLLLLHKKSVYTFSFHLLVTLLFSFTRDSWPYVLVLFYILYTLISIKWQKRYLHYMIGLIVFSSIVFIVQQKSAQIGHRHRLPVINNIVFRILPNDEYLQWFSDKGMPSAEALKESYSIMDNWKDVYPLYNDTSYVEFGEWAGNEGKNVYAEFLLTHPSFLFLLEDNPEDIKRMLSYNFGYTGSCKGYSCISQSFFPFFSLISILILNVFLLFLFIKEKRVVWIFPTVLMIIFAFNAFLLYTADSLEQERHLFITNIMIQFLGILLVAFILDSEYLSNCLNKLKIHKRKNSNK